MRPHGTPEELERRRHRAVRLFREGHQPVDVARMVGVDRRSVRRWNAAYQTQGHAALAAKPASGRPPRLNARAVKLLTGTLVQGARPASTGVGQERRSGRQYRCWRCGATRCSLSRVRCRHAFEDELAVDAV